MNDSVSVRFDDDARKRLEDLASKSGLSLAHLVRRATLEYLRKAETEGQLPLILHDAPHKAKKNGHRANC